MSDTPVLPLRPHLNILKQRAKEALQRLREKDPTAKLAEAQLLVARESGFPSWRALKREVDRIRLENEKTEKDGKMPTEAQAKLAEPLGEELIKQFSEALRGDIQRVREMLDNHPQLAGSGIRGESMLHIAAEYDRAAAIPLLIERGANPNAYWTNTLHTPLSWAVTNDTPHACKALMEGGATVDLFCAAGMGMLEKVGSYFDEAGRVRAGASITGSSRRREDGTRIMALATDPIEVVSDALYIACRNGRPEVAIYLLERGGNPNFRAYMEATCFHWAYFGGGDPKLIEAILAHGGDANAIQGDQKRKPREFGVYLATRWGWRYYLDRILRNDRSLANLAHGGTTPLHEAAMQGKVDVLKCLLDYGADRTAFDAEGKTALDRAVAAGKTEAAALLKA